MPSNAPIPSSFKDIFISKSSADLGDRYEECGSNWLAITIIAIEKMSSSFCWLTLFILFLYLLIKSFFGFVDESSDILAKRNSFLV